MDERPDAEPPGGEPSDGASPGAEQAGGSSRQVRGLRTLAGIALLVALGFLLPRPRLPSWVALPDLPDLPLWLRLLIGPGKLLVLLVLVVLGAVGEWERRRR